MQEKRIIALIGGILGVHSEIVVFGRVHRALTCHLDTRTRTAIVAIEFTETRNTRRPEESPSRLTIRSSEYSNEAWATGEVTHRWSKTDWTRTESDLGTHGLSLALLMGGIETIEGLLEIGRAHV